MWSGVSSCVGCGARSVLLEHGGGDHGGGQGEDEESSGSHPASVTFLPSVAGIPECIDKLPLACEGGRVEKIAVVVQDGVEAFGLGVICEVWDEPYHPEDDNPVFEFTLCTPEPGRVCGASVDLHVEQSLDVTADADLVFVAPKRGYRDHHPAAVAAVQAAGARGAFVSAHCTGVWLLGEAGLLDGRECTTHWRYGSELQEAFPTAIVRPEVLYVLDGTVLTGAGSAAGIDASLHLMRRELGARTATTTARRIVMPPHRTGGQAQFVRTPIRSVQAETLSPVLEWALEHIDEPLPVERLAARAHMSQRTFARRFRDETGTTPLQWLTSQRIALAEELLESSTLSVDQVASRVGFGNAATLRHHFTQALGTTPQEFRRTFGQLVGAGV